MYTPKLEITQGHKFGSLTVVRELNKLILPSGQKNRLFECICDCGNTKNVRLVHLSRGRISSCGCKSKTRNGESATSLHKVWKQMIARCMDDYFEKHLYFDKGIAVCLAWQNSFPDFKKWSLENGYKKGLQIDRENGSEGYNPGNCRWVTAKINMNNKSTTLYVTYKGEKISLQLLLDKLHGHNAHYYAIRSRIIRGWSEERAIETPIRKGNYTIKDTYREKIKQER